jgi:hypothetical protein
MTRLHPGGISAMRRKIALRTNSGRRIAISLDNWGGGVDRLFRRWTREYDGWRCVETGEFGRQIGLLASFFSPDAPKGRPAGW